MNTANKKLLILGGTSASLDLVRNAKKMGIYTIVTDNNKTGVAKEIADETAQISTADIAALVAYCKEQQVDGIFCGPSEFNLRNVIRAANEANLPCYTTTPIWDRCANKDVFKHYCRQYHVDCTPEYNIDRNTTMAELEAIPYPIIIKPVDGCSSAGISVCHTADDVGPALEKAYGASKSQKIIAEKFIENNGEIFSVRYMLQDGEAYPYFLMDTYVVDPVHRVSLISGYSCAPSKYARYYMEHMDADVREMLKGMGLKDGTAFIQALPYDGKIYFHEMGYRLSGGMLFKLTEPLANINDMQIMLRGAVGGPYLLEEEANNIDWRCKGKRGGQLMVPLQAGVIGSISGLDEILANKAVCDCIQYYQVGDTISPALIGTLGQHFCRITFIADTAEQEKELIAHFQSVIKISDTNGKQMNCTPFSVSRMEGRNI